MLYWLTKVFKQKFVSYDGFLQSSITGRLYPATMRYYPNGLTVVVDEYNVIYQIAPISGSGGDSYIILKNDSYSNFFLSVKK